MSWGFFRQEYRSRLPFPSPGDLCDPGIFATHGSNLYLLHGYPDAFIFIFLMWTIFKIFIEFVIIQILLYVLVFWP